MNYFAFYDQTHMNLICMKELILFLFILVDYREKVKKYINFLLKIYLARKAQLKIYYLA